jgi:hypothetical protein
MVASRAFVQSVFGVPAPDAVHELLAQKGAIPLLFGHGLYGLALLRDREVPARAFRSFHALLIAADAGFILLGWEMLRAATAPEPRAAAIAQIAVALGRIALRGAFLRSSRPAANDTDSSQSSARDPIRANQRS